MEGLNLLLKLGQSQGLLTRVKVSRLKKILHLLFVDDVLILKNNSLHEWSEIKNILFVFCRATSLQRNWSKSSFHYSNLSDQTLFQLHLLFPYTFTNLSESFNYFGYFMKANSYRIADWNWLLEKVKK